MNVSDIMSKRLKTVGPDETIQKAAKMMYFHRIGSLVVVSGIVLTGIITERDMLKAFAKAIPPTTKVKDVMSGYVVTVRPDATLEDASKLMIENRIKRLVVTDDSGCIGIVTATDIVSHEKALMKGLKPLLTRKRNGE